MKYMFALAALASLIVSTECLAQENKKAEEEALSAAENWLVLVDDGKYGESWDGAAELFKSAITRDGWITALESARKPLGKVITREFKSGSYQTNIPGAPEGEYVIIQLSTSFENKSSSTETVTPTLDKDGKWKVSGYYVR